MSLGIEDVSRPARVRAAAVRVLTAAVLLMFSASYAANAPRPDAAPARVSLIDVVEMRADPVAPPASCETPLEPTQADGEARGCCVLVTNEGPRCAFTSRGYCAMRAQAAGVQFEFHDEVASCAELAQCR